MYQWRGLCFGFPSLHACATVSVDTAQLLSRPLYYVVRHVRKRNITIYIRFANRNTPECSLATGEHLERMLERQSSRHVRWGRGRMKPETAHNLSSAVRGQKMPSLCARPGDRFARSTAPFSQPARWKPPPSPPSLSCDSHLHSPQRLPRLRPTARQLRWAARFRPLRARHARRRPRR